MNSRRCWFIDISAQGVPGRHGTGEAAPLEGLSEEGEERVLRDLLRLKDWLESMDASMPEDLLSAGQIGERLDLCSSVRFAFEMAAMEMASGRKGRYFDCPLNSGIPVPVNGLIWMAEIAEMKEQAKDKALQGFQCIKFKVGGQRFEEECAMLEWVRGSEWGKTLEIRLDANGAFGPADVMEKLHRLAAFRIQSIEQPVRAGNMALMKEVCIESPIPVALDEELIGVRGADKERLLSEIRPAFIVLKPSLHGGFSGAFEWLRVAKGSGIGWWLTSLGVSKT